jgi:C4-dicarboxylate transporter, DctM subunit
MGGIWGGVFTPTEAGAVGAAGALLVAAVTGMRWRGLVSSFSDTAMATGSIMVLLVTAQLYSRMLSTSGFVDRIGEIVTSWDVSPHVVVVMFVAFLIVLGTVLDSSSIILITVPLMFPVVTELGLDPLWFGIVMIVAVEVGIITPPFGMIPFAMSGVLGEQVDIVDIFRGAVPFIVMMLLVLALLVAFAPLATWLPGEV